MVVNHVYTDYHQQFLKYISMKKLLLVELCPVADLSLVTAFVMADYVHQLQVRPEFKSVIGKKLGLCRPIISAPFLHFITVGPVVEVRF